MKRRGLSLLELMLSITITMMVGAAIAAMLGAVSMGVGTRRDSRTSMLLANAAQSRLAAYIAPARCVLDMGSSGLVLWAEDSRAGETVHATEVRWLLYDKASGEIGVYWINFPDAWNQAARDLEDQECESDEDWMALFATYHAKGYTSGRILVDGLAGLDIVSDQANPLDARHMMFNVQFAAQAEAVSVVVTGTIRSHQVPVS